MKTALSFLVLVTALLALRDSSAQTQPAGVEAALASPDRHDASKPDDSTIPTDLPTSLTTDDVLAMMRRLPSRELGKDHYRWDRVGQANRIASAIARTATTRDEAGDLVVYSVFESNLRLSAVGDSGKSHGPWQLSARYATPEVARIPEKAAPIWLAAAAQARRDCAKLPEDEQLAEVASGSCKYGRQLARRRAALRRIALKDPSAFVSGSDAHEVTGIE
jgi:hypothetical protein